MEHVYPSTAAATASAGRYLIASARAIAASFLLLALVLLLALPAKAEAAPGDDWRHAQQVVARLKAAPPSRPVVVLLGGSVARECTIDDISWGSQVLRRGGRPVVARNLGSSNQTFAQSNYLVEQLPPGPTVVFVGITYGRFTAKAGASFWTTTEPPTDYIRHRYTVTAILSVSEKRARVGHWLDERYPVFRENYAYNLERLEQLVQTCLARGFACVLLDLPRNTAIIGHALDEPMLQYRADCQALAGEYGVDWYNPVPRARLVNGDFYDFVHLVEPGRPKWQRLLSDKTVSVLAARSALATPLVEGLGSRRYPLP